MPWLGRFKRNPRQLEERIADEQEKLKALSRQYEELKEQRKRLEGEVKRLQKEVDRLRSLKRRLEEREETAWREALDAFKDWFDEALDGIVVETLRRANEKPPVWWQWLLLILVGMVGGVGLGMAISYIIGAQNPIPIHVVCR